MTTSRFDCGCTISLSECGCTFFTPPTHFFHAGHFRRVWQTCGPGSDGSALHGKIRRRQNERGRHHVDQSAHLRRFVFFSLLTGKFFCLCLALKRQLAQEMHERNSQSEQQESNEHWNLNRESPVRSERTLKMEEIATTKYIKKAKLAPTDA